MNGKVRKTVLLVLSCASLITAVGYSSWAVQAHKEYSLNNHDDATRPVAYIVGKEKIKYTSIEKALDVAQSGDIVLAIPPTGNNYHSTNNKITPNKVTYRISRGCEIKAGVTLVIPTDASTCSSIKDSSTLNEFIKSMSNDDRNRGGNYAKLATDDSSHYLRVTIEIDDGVTLKNSGNLIISGYLSGGNASSGAIGRTSHSYSRILLGKDSQIIQSASSANTYCFGFIFEKSADNGSQISIDQGKLYVPLVIYDYRGFTFSVALTDGALSKQHCSPFNQFGIENIGVSTTVKYSGIVIGVSNLYVKYNSSLGNVDQNYNNELTLVGNSSGSFIQFSDSTYSSLISHYSIEKKAMTLNIVGGINLNNIDLELKATSTMSISFSTVDSFLPVSNMYNVTLSRATNQTSATFNFSKQRVKLLPGAQMLVEDGCSITGSDIVVYSAFYDGTIGNGVAAANAYNSVKYPLLEGAKLIMKGSSVMNITSFGGIVYSDNSNCVVATSNTCVSKEAWNWKSSGGIIPPWTIDDYLEIREKATIVPYNYLSKKKIYCGANIFTENSANVPSYGINLGGSSVTINGYQGVVFIDKDQNYKVDLNSNIYKAFSGSQSYVMDSSIASAKSNIVGVVNSSLTISSNNAGKNEFKVQSVTVTCATPLVDGEVPLYVDSAIQLRATVDDIEKSYDKVVKWTTSDASVATVDSTGKVTGHKLGDVTIYAECGGVTGTFATKVISSVKITPISSITIKDSKNDSATMNVSDGASQTFSSFNSSNKYTNNQNINFTLSLNDGAKWASIEWTLTASQTGRQYINDSGQQVNMVADLETITVHTVSGTGSGDDDFSLSAKVTELGTGNTYTMTLALIHKADKAVCFEKGTIVATKRGLVPVENIKSTDELLSYNHFTGQMEYKRIAAVIDHGFKGYRVISLEFDDGSSIGFINSHGLFDVDLNCYVDFTNDNYREYIGHYFLAYEEGNLVKKRLAKAEIIVKNTASLTVVSSENLNCIANGFLNITSVLKGVYNIFEYDENHNYDHRLMNEEISKYGLYEYSDFEKLITRKIFVDLGFKYFKVSIAKGLMTYETLLFYINWLKSCIESGEATIY